MTKPYNAQLVPELNNYILSNYLFTDMEGKVHVSSYNHGYVQGWSAQKLVITDGITVIAAYPTLPDVPQIDLSDIRRWIDEGCKESVELEVELSDTYTRDGLQPRLDLTNNTVKMVWGEVEWKLTDGIVQTRLEQDKAQPIAGNFVVIKDYYLDNGHHELKDNAFLASIPSMAGLCECAATKSDALYELMLSLEVKLAYDLGIELSSKRHHPATDWDALYAKFYNYYHNEPQSGGVSDIFQWFKNELTK